MEEDCLEMKLGVNCKYVIFEAAGCEQYWGPTQKDASMLRLEYERPCLDFSFIVIGVMDHFEYVGDTRTSLRGIYGAADCRSPRGSQSKEGGSQMLVARAASISKRDSTFTNHTAA